MTKKKPFKNKPKMTPKVSDADIALDRIGYYREHFVEYVRKELQVEPTNQQIEALEVFQRLCWAKIKRATKKRLTKGERAVVDKIGVSIHSGKGTGKDFFAACLIILFLDLWTPFKGIGTASNKAQLEQVLSTQVRRLLSGAKPHVRDQFVIDQSGIYLKDGSGKKGNDFLSKRTASVRAGTDSAGQSMAGYHEKFMLNIVDEASDVPDAVIAKLEETLTNICNLILLIGNVTRAHGAFYRSHYDEKYRDMFVCLRWNGEESNIDDIIPGHSAYIERLSKAYGKESNVYRVSVLGLPPAEEKDALVPWEWILAAKDRWKDLEVDQEHDPVMFGVDVGAGGDDSAICRRVGGKVMSCETKSTRDTNVLADWLDEKMELFEPDFTIIDSNGLGRSFCDSFRRFYNREIVELNVGSGASNSEKYFRLRDEIWIDRVRREFAEGRIAIDPEDQELAMELSSLKVVDWHQEPLKVISKRQMRALGLKSPNKADALMHTYIFHGSGSAERKHESSRYRERKTTNSTSWMAL